jgi:hypothetical protein
MERLAQAVMAATELHRLFLAAALPMLVVVVVENALMQAHQIQQALVDLEAAEQVTKEQVQQARLELQTQAAVVEAAAVQELAAQAVLASSS